MIKGIDCHIKWQRHHVKWLKHTSKQHDFVINDIFFNFEAEINSRISITSSFIT
jgi:hypothetical protein